MRLDRLTVGTLRSVLAVYDRVAYEGGGAVAKRISEIEGHDEDPIDKTLVESMEGGEGLIEEVKGEGPSASRQFSLRLGNARYPFMKVVLQEHLVEGEFFFEVDTHDQMFALDGEEGLRFEALKRHNREVKEAVERAWDEAGLPTTAQIRGVVASRLTRQQPSNGKTILVVDDDRDLAESVALLLKAGGFSVQVVEDGREAVAIADPQRHDLVLMDNEMRDLNGFEACRILKTQEKTAQIPVLIATAGSLTLRQLDAADGFMVKPFKIEMLFSILTEMLEMHG